MIKSLTLCSKIRRAGLSSLSRRAILSGLSRRGGSLTRPIHATQITRRAGLSTENVVSSSSFRCATRPKFHLKVSLLLILCAVFCSSCSLDDLIIDPNQTDSYSFPNYIIPASQRQLVTFDSDGNTLYGAYIKTLNPDRETGYTILYCHGRERDMTGYWFEVELHYLAGFDCLTFDYRGFGRSEGEATLDGLYADGRAALSFLIDSMHVNPDSIILHGVSLGSGVAAYLASEVMSPYRIILETPYANAEGWSEVILPLNLPPSFVIDGDFDNLQFVRNFTAPLLVIHGGRDRVLPFEHHGQVVYDAAPEPKELVFLPEAGHTDILVYTGDFGYQSLMRNFVLSTH